MDQWFQKILGLFFMGMAFLVLTPQIIQFIDSSSDFMNQFTSPIFLFGTIIYIAAALLLFLLGLKMFRKKKKSKGKDVLDDFE